MIGVDVLREGTVTWEVLDCADEMRLKTELHVMDESSRTTRSMGRRAEGSTVQHNCIRS
jgi:hypothetical protein